jgi:hypothetical protein
MDGHPVSANRVKSRPADLKARFLVVGASLVLTYLIATLTLMTRWMNFWIRGPYYVAYQVIFFTVLAPLLFLWSGHHKGPRSPLSTVVFCTLAGYAAGLVALALHPIFQSNGPQQVMLSLTFPAPEALFAFFWFPVKILSWLIGGVAGTIIVMLSRWHGSMRQTSS